MEPYPIAPDPQAGAVAAARALVHRLADELTLISGYVELLAPHVRREAVVLLAEVEQASHDAEKLTVQMSVLLQGMAGGEERGGAVAKIARASAPPPGPRPLRAR